MKTIQKAGRKLKYGEHTTLMRIPDSMVETVQQMLNKREVMVTQWEDKTIGPDAQKLVDLITERMLFPQIALIKAMRDSKMPSFIAEAENLEKELNNQRNQCRDLIVKDLIEVLKDDD